MCVCVCVCCACGMNSRGDEPECARMSDASLYTCVCLCVITYTRMYVHVLE